ncbi:hypothetical protein [Bacillus sp. AY2-1]|uniref:hypothetical protein n=1 Tax=Bacillus sp. AY2-1 TaxID=2217828 RepID=UPI0011EEBB39|nr:hypothetical protein [Bacillus sp. AY2-1]KAA0820128.1 hypothetical protein DN403_21215 [Bacillus sp. AY2-1]
MYLREEQETIINIHEESGEITLYTCAQRYVIKVMEVADKYQLPIVLRDVIDGFPQPIEMKTKSIQAVIHVLGA